VPTLYTADRCPYAARVRIVLAEKGLAYDAVEIDLDDRPAWLYEKNPLGRVPVYEEDEGLVLPESVVIMEYLDERYPEPALMPPDAAERALVRLQIERFDQNFGDAYYAFRRGDDGGERLAHCLSLFERNIGRWTNRYTLAEIAYVPWLIRLRDLIGFDLDPYPSLAERLERVLARPAIAAEREVVAAL
jgi:glutathione S-transferase